MARTSSTSGGTNLAIVITATAAIAILANVVLSGSRARIDLTENQVNELSDASRDAVAALDDLEVRVYLSPDMPEEVTFGPNEVATRPLGPKLLDKLDEYKAYGSNVTITIIDGKDAVAEAKDAGLKPFTDKDGANISADGEVQFDEYVIGASFHYQNATEVFDMAFEPSSYEYEITKRLLRLKDKADGALLMKDLLAAGTTLGDAAKSCAATLESAVPKANKDDNDLVSMLSGEAAAAKVASLKAAVPAIKTSCAPVAEAAAKAEPYKKKNGPLDHMVALAKALDERIPQLDQALAAEDPQMQSQALQVHQQLAAIAKAIEPERSSMEDSPGLRRIGFVCNAKTFCPFPNSKPLVPKELEGALTQKNQILGQMLPRLEQIQQEMNQILQQIGQGVFKARGFDIVEVDLDKTLPDDMPALVVYGAKVDFSDWQLSQLDQFVMNGGALIVFLDPWDADIQLYGARGDIQRPSLKKNTSNISTLLTHYGLKPNGGMVLEPASYGKLDLMHFIQQGDQLIPLQAKGVAFPMMPTFTSFDSSDPLVRATASLTLPFVTWITLEPPSGVEATALIKSTPEARSIDRLDMPLTDNKAQIAMLQPGDERASMLQADQGPFTVAAVARGKFTSYFAGKAAPQKPEEKKEGEDGDKTKPQDVPGKDKPRLDAGEGRVFVLGSNLGLEPLSNDVIFDGFDLSMIAGEGMDWIEKFQQYGANYRNWSTRIQQIQRTLMENIQFLQNILDWSVQRGGLAELRSKQSIMRPLETTTDGDKTRYRVMGLVVPAALFLAAGGVWAFLRNRRRKALAL